MPPKSGAFFHFAYAPEFGSSGNRGAQLPIAVNDQTATIWLVTAACRLARDSGESRRNVAVTGQTASGPQSAKSLALAMEPYCSDHLLALRSGMHEK